MLGSEEEDEEKKKKKRADIPVVRALPLAQVKMNAFLHFRPEHFRAVPAH